jgi:hypothetical protein
MLNAELSIALDTNSDAANAVRGELAKCASELVVRYGLAGDVTLTVEAEPALPGDGEPAQTLGLSRHVAVTREDIRALAQRTVDEGGQLSIDYVKQNGDSTTRIIHPRRLLSDRVLGDDDSGIIKSWLFEGIQRAEVM